MRVFGLYLVGVSWQIVINAQEVFVADCHEPTNAEFIVIKQNFNDFDAAATACTQLTPSATLARIDNPDAYNNVILTLINAEVFPDNSEKDLWIGLQDPNPQSGSQGSDTTRFEFIDGMSGNRTFFLTPRVAPWEINSQPNDADNDDCVMLRRKSQSENGWQDFKCSTDSNAAVCRRECPGSVPAPTPANEATNSPVISTANPTTPTNNPGNEEGTNSPSPLSPSNNKNSFSWQNLVTGIGAIMILLVPILLITFREYWILSKMRNQIGSIESELAKDDEKEKQMLKIKDNQMINVDIEAEGGELELDQEDDDVENDLPPPVATKHKKSGATGSTS